MLQCKQTPSRRPIASVRLPPAVAIGKNVDVTETVNDGTGIFTYPVGAEGGPGGLEGGPGRLEGAGAVGEKLMIGYRYYSQQCCMS